MTVIHDNVAICCLVRISKIAIILSLPCRVSQPCTSVRCSSQSAARCCMGELDSCWLQWPSSDGGQICPVQSVWSRDHLPTDWWRHSGPVLWHHYPAQPDPVCVEGGSVQWPLLAGCGWSTWRHNRQIQYRYTKAYIPAQLVILQL